MKTILWALFVGIAVTFGGGSVALAADAPDPAVGTWTLNLAKSKFGTSPASKSETRTYAQTAQGMSLKIDEVAADGSRISVQSTYKYDGKDYPVAGSPDFDTLSVTQVDARSIKYTVKKKGKVVGTGTRTISADGKVLTLSATGTSDISVYDKQ